MWHEMAAAEMAPDNRFEWFEQVVSDVLLPTEFRAADPGGFDARGGMLDLGAAQLARFSYAPLSSRRTPALIRKGDPEQYQLGLVTSGTAWFAQQGGEAELGVGGMALWDTSKPYESGSGMDGSEVEVVVLQIPKARMPLPSQRVDRLLARRIPGTAGFAAILAGSCPTSPPRAPTVRPDSSTCSARWPWTSPRPVWPGGSVPRWSRRPSCGRMCCSARSARSSTTTSRTPI
ncbi:hypothetical protein OHA46_27550 [Streptomyces sp. NBC_00708]